MKVTGDGVKRPDEVLPGGAHLSPCAGPARGAPLPGSRRRVRPPGAAASSWVEETVSSLSLIPRSYRGGSPAHPYPCPGLACPSTGSRRQPLLQSRRHSREKSPIRGAELRAGSQAARPPPSVPEAAPPLPQPG